MIKLESQLPLEGQYVHEVQELNFKEITSSNCNNIYLKNPVVDKKLIETIKKFLNRKRPYLIYIESEDNTLIKEELKNHPKKHMVSYIYDFMEMEKAGHMTIYDYIRVDLENNMEYWDKLLRFSEKVPCVYIIKNAPDLSKVKHIPSNYRFDYETNQEEI